MEEFLSHKSIPFISKDISQDPKALEELQEMGYFVTPVTLIDGEAVLGFDRKKLEALLANS